MKWIDRVSFRDLLTLYDDNDREHELEQIAALKPKFAERLADSVLAHFAPEVESVRTEAQFNALLNRIYDYCDANRIWVELS